MNSLKKQVKQLKAQLDHAEERLKRDDLDPSDEHEMKRQVKEIPAHIKRLREHIKNNKEFIKQVSEMQQALTYGQKPTRLGAIAATHLQTAAAIMLLEINGQDVE